jgi:hypothetical protein
MADKGLALAQDFIGLLEFAVLPLQRLELIALRLGQAVAITIFDRLPVDPAAQRSATASELLRDGGDRLRP